MTKVGGVGMTEAGGTAWPASGMAATPPAPGAALALTLAGAATAPALAQEVSVSITTTPANGIHYVAGEAITTRLTMPQIASGNVAGARMKLDIGGVERQATSTSTYAY